MEKVGELKKNIITELVKTLESSLGLLEEEKKQVTQSAIAAPGRMQSRYDSSKQELSYFANALGVRIENLRAEINVLRDFQTAGDTKEIQLGSIFGLKREDEEINYYFVSPVGAGNEINTESFGLVTIVSTEAPLVQALLKKKKGDSTIVNSKKVFVKDVI